MEVSEYTYAALYIRVSTDDQLELSPDAQKRLLLEYAKKNNLHVLDEHIYVDGGISGRKADKRPEFIKMISVAKNKGCPFSTILVWKFSRFARNQEESIVYKSLLRKNHIDVVSISEPLPEGAIGTLVERIFEWMDEYYSINLSGEVMRGMTEGALRGNYQANPPIGYTHVKDGTPIIDEEKAPIVRNIFQWYVDGMTYKQICEELNSLGCVTDRGNPFESRVIRYIISNPFYIGKVRWNYFDRKENKRKDDSEVIIADGKHEPMISMELWQATQDRFFRTTRSYKSRDAASSKHWLTGTVRCSCCGASMTRTKDSTGRYYWQCWKYGKGLCSTSHSITQVKLEKAIFEGLEKSAENVKDYKITVRQPQNRNTEIEALKKQLSKIELKERRIKESYIAGIDTIEEYRENKALVLEERTKVEVEIQKASESSVEMSRQECEKILQGKIRELLNTLMDDSADTVKKALALREVVDRIIFDKVSNSLEFEFFV